MVKFQKLKKDNLFLLAILVKFSGLIFYDIKHLFVIANVSSIILLFLLLVVFEFSSFKINILRFCGILSLLVLLGFHIFHFSSIDLYELKFYITIIFSLLFIFIADSFGHNIALRFFLSLAIMIIAKLLYISLIGWFLFFKGPSAQYLVNVFSSYDVAWLSFGKYTFPRIADNGAFVWLGVFTLFTVRMSYIKKLLIFAIFFNSIIFNMSIAIFIGTIFAFILYLFLIKKYLEITYIFLLLSFFIFTNIDSLLEIYKLKMYSFEVKLAQFNLVNNLFINNFFGSGFGVISEGLFRGNDKIFENSYLYLIYSFGIFGFLIIFILAFLFIILFIKNKTNFDSILISYLLFILIACASNPYLFSGTTYVIIFFIYKYIWLDSRQEVSYRRQNVF